jgi:hypothetical protein
MINRTQSVNPVVPQHPVTAVKNEEQYKDHGQLHQHSHGHFQGKHFRPGSGPPRQAGPRARGPTPRRSPRMRSSNEDESFDNYDPDEQDLAAEQKAAKPNGEQKEGSQDSSDQQQQQQQRQAKWKIKASPKTSPKTSSKNQSVEQAGATKVQTPVVLHRSFASAMSIQKHFAAAALNAINSSQHEKPNLSIRSRILPEMLAVLLAMQKDKSLMGKVEFSTIKEELIKISQPVSSADNSPAQETYRRLLPLMLHSLGRHFTSTGIDGAISRLKAFHNSLGLINQRARAIPR